MLGPVRQREYEPIIVGVAHGVQLGVAVPLGPGEASEYFVIIGLDDHEGGAFVVTIFVEAFGVHTVSRGSEY
jgi:hypothetical protein